MSEKCFCHFNGYAVKDATARAQIIEEADQRATEIAVERARIDTFVALPEGSTTGDAELQDIRVGFDGNTYATAGEAVRAQVALVDNDLSNVLTYAEATDVTALLNIDGGVKNNGASYSSTSFKRSDYLHLQKGCVITGKKIRTSDLSAIALYNEGKVFDSENSIVGGNTIADYTLTMPYDGFVRLCCRVAELDAGGTFTIINEIGTQLSSLSVVRDVASVISKYTVSADAINENTYSYINKASNGSVETTTSAIGCSSYRICKAGDTLKYKLSVDTSNPILATYDKGLNLVSYIDGTGRNNYLEGEYVFAENEAFFRIGGASAYLANYYAEYVSAYKINTTGTENSLPDYYTDYMAERITAINNKDCLIGSHGDSFVFITDTHLERNKMKSPALIKEIVSKSSVRFVINGGDTLDADDTWGEAIGRLREWRNLMCGVTEYRVMGNHDLNKSGNDVADAYLTTDDWYGTMVKPIEDIVKTDGKYYFCVDNESQKIRYICLSYMADAWAERDWLKTKLTELEAGWTALVISHYLFTDATGTIHSTGQLIIDAINEVYANMNATLIGILAGHNHADYATTEATNGYHLIATTCDALTGTPTKTAGTTTEQAFDVIHIDTKNRKLYATRIGAGVDREWSY